MAHPNPANSTRVVAVGASAGGVEALTALFQSLPPIVDAAFLVVLHIPAHSHSHLAQILAAETRMQVATARDGEPIQPGHVYVARADYHLMVGDGMVRLTRGPRECRVRPAIDVLFRSTALHYGPRAIGVVLSGALDDGAAGLWSIKDRRGTVLVQDPSDARFPSMPESALRHVTPDLVGTIQVLAAEIARLSSEPDAQTPHPEPTPRLTLESLIAGEGHPLQHGVSTLGALSRYSCPECHGVLAQIEEGSLVRFRCHAGHAYSLQTLVAGINDSIDAGLWAAVSALEERRLLLGQICDMARRHGTAAEVQSYETQARYVESRIGAVRALVLDPELFGDVPLAS